MMCIELDTMSNIFGKFFSYRLYISQRDSYYRFDTIGEAQFIYGKKLILVPHWAFRRFTDEEIQNTGEGKGKDFNYS